MMGIDKCVAFCRLERLALGLVSLIGATVLGAWLLPTFAGWLPEQWHIMTASTALGLLVSSAGLLSTQHPSRLAQGVAAGSVVLVVALVAVSVLMHLSTDVKLWPAMTEGALVRPMSLQTDMGLALVAAYIWLSKGAERSPAQAVILVLLFGLCLVVTNGYFENQWVMVGQTPLIRTSAHTLTCLWLLWLVGVMQYRLRGSAPMQASQGLGEVVTARVLNLIRALTDGS